MTRYCRTARVNRDRVEGKHQRIRQPERVTVATFSLDDCRSELDTLESFFTSGRCVVRSACELSKEDTRGFPSLHSPTLASWWSGTKAEGWRLEAHICSSTLRTMTSAFL